MAQLAKVQLLNATIGRDAETKQTPSGTTLLKFPVAVNHRGSDGQDVATWYEVTIWGKQAETLAGFNLSKGTRVCVDGRLKPRSYQGRQGDTRISLDVDATDVIVVSPEKHRAVHEEAARRFSAFMLANTTQQAIAEFGQDRFGVSLFIPYPD